MSFSFDVKEDILKFNMETSSHLVEVEAWLRFAGEIIISNPIKLAFSSANMHILRYYIALLKQFYSDITYEIETRTMQKLNRKPMYYCIISNQAKTIIEDLSLLDPVSIHKEEIINDLRWSVAYIRGAFLAKGSVNDPKTSNYHFEISTDKETEAWFLQRVINNYNLNARIIKRRNHLIVYIKEKDCIVEILRRVGANVTMNEFENAIIKRELSANVNRVVNIDVANQQKTNRSAKEQLKYIHYLEMYYPMDRIDPKLKLVMEVRKENAEASLQELIGIINKKYNEEITKSGLNHRFRKIKELAIDFDTRRKS